MDGPPAPLWSEQRNAAAIAGSTAAAAAEHKSSAHVTMTTMTATMTTAYVAKIAAALNKADSADSKLVLPLSCPGVVDAQDFKGWTAVLLASECGGPAGLAIVQQLLSVQCDIDRANSSYDTPLHAAATSGHADVSANSA